jgi:lipoate-protein ligase B
MTTSGYLFDLKRTNYSDTLTVQRKLAELRAARRIPDSLILTEHDHVFTVGKSVQEKFGDQINFIPVVQIERGGEWTYHGPGQLVGYPILDLEARSRNIHEFVRNLEETLIRTLSEFGISPGRNQAQPGVWAKDKKVASIGVAVRKWVTYHGFALNVNTDMNCFSMITPCGLPSTTMTSMETILQHRVAMDEVKSCVSRMFQEVFQIQLENKPIEELPSAEAT